MSRTLAIALCVAISAGSRAQAASRPRYGGELALLLPPASPEPEQLDPATSRTPLELLLARALCEPLFQIGPGGALAPGLAQVPAVDPRGRLLVLELRPGLRFAGGASITARDVAASLAHLAAPGSPYRALLLPLAGGPGGHPAVVARGASEVALTFDFAYPDWPLGLVHPGICALPASRVRRPGAWESGAFQGAAGASGFHLAANDACPAGRPYVDRLLISPASPRTAARALASGQADVSLVPVAEQQPAEGPLSVATYLVVNPRRPGFAALPALASATLDRQELVRMFVHPPSVPLYGLLAPSVEPHPAPAAPLSPAAQLSNFAPLHARGTLLVERGEEDQGAVADRLQVKLHDRGVDLQVAALPRAELWQRIAGGDFDAAVASVPALPEAGLNLAQVLLLAGQGDAARSELLSLGTIPDPSLRRERASARARALLPGVPVVPLYARGLAVTAMPRVQGLRFAPTGEPDLGDLWLEDAR